MSKLADFVKSRREEQEVDAAGIIQEWKQELDKLMSTIDEWLGESVKAGLKVQKATVEVSEEMLGTYEATKLVIELAGRRVVIEPHARIIVGGHGRVNVDGDFGMDLLIFSKPDDTWYVVRDRASMKGERLTKETFEQVLEAHL